MIDAIEAIEDTETTQAEESGAEKSKPKHVDEMKTGQRDPFSAAFNEAQDELAGEDDERAPKPKPKAKAKKEETPKEEPKAKPKPKEQPEQAAEEAEEGEEGDEDEGEGEAKEKKKGPLEPKKWWSRQKRDAFPRLPRHVQEAWLAEAPKPDQRWTPEEKEAFSKMPAEGQEILLGMRQEIERGYGEKFEALAAERKLSEAIKASVPPQMRQFMQSRGLTEAQVVPKLFAYQNLAMTDPVGYVRKIIGEFKINPLDIIPVDGDGKPAAQTQTQQAANPMAHPDVQRMAAELQQLRAERQKIAEAQIQQNGAEFDGLLKETDGEGNSLYPFIRVLADPMASIIEREPDRFSGLGPRERLAAAYHEALDSFPELAALQWSAPEPKADEPDGDTAEPSEEDKRRVKLEKAASPKSRSTQTPPPNDGATSLDDALRWATKKIGKR